MTTAVAHRVENAEVAPVLREIADLLEVKCENAFRIRAYRTAARVIDELPYPVQDAGHGLNINEYGVYRGATRIAGRHERDHSAAELRFMRWGVDQARRAWVTRTDVVNTKPLPQLLRLLARHRAAG